MRLINVDTLELEEFFDDSIPRYAILSHTWGQEEVSFQDLCWLHDYEKNRMTYTSLEALIPQIGQNMKGKATEMRQRAGFDKIVQSARLAKERELQYVWVDTCCIDKTSSAELSEAINSMFRWYQRSEICFAFLSDVDKRDQGHGGLRFEDSRWFTRGWTLQELLSPSLVMFYDRTWTAMNTRDALAHLIEDITGIPEDALAERYCLNSWSFADRMSWASKRTTSRKEDMAYCLMGFFQVNMPLLYGEGEKAFVRLQQEIIKEHGDQSLLAWGYNESVLTHSSIFAPSPAFMGSAKIGEDNLSSIAPFHLSNKGLEISLDIFQVPTWNAGLSDVYYALWDVWFSRSGDTRRQKTHRLCLPLSPALFSGKELVDGQHMVRCPSGPLMIASKHVPDRRSHQRILIAKEHAWYWGFERRCTWIHLCMQQLHRVLPSARLVEVFPPALYMEPAGPGARFWFSNIDQPEVYIFRFLIPNDFGEEVTKGGQSVQLVVVAVLPCATSAYDEGTSTTMSVTAVEWMDGSRRAGAGRSQDDGTTPFCSLADAACAGVPLLDARRRFDNSVPFLIDGRPLKVAIRTDPQPVLFGRGQHDGWPVSISFYLSWAL
ncbi:het domain-containing protein [Colletotrichum kahawae]|uniref:Het domain-containing protein n=1 Tax=Colletotrichum kahawae TaxID=34407 RepID=A0AAD9YQ49_COLKA|nr:het domain-containing protein [Colletotrichum kahawae]